MNGDGNIEFSTVHWGEHHCMPVISLIGLKLLWLVIFFSPQRANMEKYSISTEVKKDVSIFRA